MKEREDSEKKKRLYDAEGYTQRAGCLCFKTESEKEVCRLCVVCHTYELPQAKTKLVRSEDREQKKTNGTKALCTAQVYFIFEYISLSLKCQNERSGDYVVNVNTRR